MKKVIDKRPFVWYIITMKATKEHFEFTAALINAANNGTPAFALATLAAAKFAKDNPRFDEERFFSACGFENRASASDGTLKVKRMYGLENHAL